MAKINSIVLGLLILQTYVNAAPSDVSKLDDVTIEVSDPTLDAAAEGSSENSSQRQKRWYPHTGFGFSTSNPFLFTNNVKRDNTPETGVYGYEDPFTHIQRRLQEIAGFISQPSFAQPVAPPFPVYLPVVIVPPVGCACTPDTNPSPPPLPETSDMNDTRPDVEIRFPEMEDVRQNWGIVVNETEVEDDDDEDVGRPISFVPIRLNRTMSRPAPPVEHGSVQGGSTNGANEVNVQITTTAQPLLSVQGFSSPSAPPVNVAPSVCDGAVLTCCHQAAVTYDCFALQGCPDPTAYGNPCDVNVILQVIDRYQRYYGQRTG